jgi:hypothetical protein
MVSRVVGSKWSRLAALILPFMAGSSCISTRPANPGPCGEGLHRILSIKPPDPQPRYIPFYTNRAVVTAREDDGQEIVILLDVCDDPADALPLQVGACLLMQPVRIEGPWPYRAGHFDVYANHHLVYEWETGLIHLFQDKRYCWPKPMK